MSNNTIVSVKWLMEHIGDDNVKVVDGTWHMPVWKRDAEAEYLQQHIEGAVRFNVEEIRDKSASLPRAIPSAEQFSEQVGNLGISNDDHVIVYDNNENFGMFSAPRVWYMFKLFGHDNVSVLDGGIPKWISEGGKVVSGPPPSVKPAVFKATYRPNLYYSYEQAVDKYRSDPSNIIDPRPPARFNGTAPEPNPKIPSGHIVGSTNLFWRNFINSDTKTLKSRDEIKQEFVNVSISLDQPVVASCGSGMTACWVSLAGALCDTEVPVFIGSWLEWYKKGLKDSMTAGVKGEDLK